VNTKSNETKTKYKVTRKNIDVLCGHYHMDIDNIASQVVAYHVTSKANVQSIISNGLTVQACQAVVYSEARIPAVYLFAAKQDANDTRLHDYLGIDNPTVVKITIPQTHFSFLRDDGLFNMSAICSDGSYPTAIQYIDNIPADWITN
jgi:hypothetical protein